MLKNIISRLRSQPTKPSNIGTFNKDTHRIVPKGSSVYDPAVFGKYDIKNQKITAISEDDGNFDLDVVVPLAQKHRSSVDYPLNCDRIELSYHYIPPGTGVFLDACTPISNNATREIAEQQGYEYLPIDINGDGENVRREDLRNLTIEDNSVAVVFSVDTLEHIDELDTALSEIQRVLQEHGIAIIHVPAYFFAREDSPDIDVNNDPYGHVRYFSGPDLVKSVYHSGLIPVRIEFNLDYGAAIVCAVKNTQLRG